MTVLRILYRQRKAINNIAFRVLAKTFPKYYTRILDRYAHPGRSENTDTFKSSIGDEGIQLERHRFKYRNSNTKIGFLKTYLKKRNVRKICKIVRKINISAAKGR